MPKVFKKSKTRFFSWNAIYGKKLTIIIVIVVAFTSGSIGMYMQRRSTALTANERRFYHWAALADYVGCRLGGAYGTLPPTIQQGSRGPCVVLAQFMLNQALPNGPIALDGNFGPATDRKVRQFQYSWWMSGNDLSGRNVDGIVGPKTWTAMYFCINTDNPPKVTYCRADIR